MPRLKKTNKQALITTVFTHSVTMIKSILVEQSVSRRHRFFYGTCFICCIYPRLNFLKMKFQMRLLFLKK